MELHVIKRKGREIVVLLDNDMRIVKPVYDYMKYQDQRDRAINTLIAYGNDLKAFWEFLSEFGYTYDEVSPKMIGEYKEYLMSEDDNIIAINKEGARTAKTINRMLSTLHGFYQYQADMQEIDNPLLMHEVNRPFNAFKGILEHVRSDNKTKQSIFKVKESDYKINLVSDDEMELFLSRLDKRRDILLYKILYLTGARIQEVLLLNVSTHLTLIYPLFTSKTCALKYTCPFIVPFSHPNKAIIQLKTTKTDSHLFILNPLEFQ